MKCHAEKLPHISSLCSHLVNSNYGGDCPLSALSFEVAGRRTYSIQDRVIFQEVHCSPVFDNVNKLEMHSTWQNDSKKRLGVSKD